MYKCMFLHIDCYNMLKVNVYSVYCNNNEQKDREIMSTQLFFHRMNIFFAVNKSDNNYS